MSGDQSILLSVAMEFVNLGKIPLAANKSSAGIFNPPLVEYLYALPLFLTRQIVSVAWFTALANVVSVGLCYGFTRRFFGSRVGVIATLLYAVSPWAVHFSRMIWNPTIIPLFSTLALGCLIAYFRGSQKPGWLIGASLSLAGVVQLHWASAVLIGVTGICGLVLHRRLRILPVAAGIALFAATFIPYYLFERATGFVDVSAFLQAGRGTAASNMAPLLLAGDLVSTRGLFQTPGAWSILDTLMRWWLWVGLAYLGVTSLRDVGRAWRSALSPTEVARLILFLWGAVPLAAYFRQTIYLQHHYLLYLYPALYIIIAVLAGDGLVFLRMTSERIGVPAGRRAMQAAAIAPLAMLLVVSGWHFRVSWARLLTSAQAGYVQIRHVTAAIAQTRALLDRTRFYDLIVLSDGPDADSSTLGLIRHFLEPETRIRFVRLGDGLLIPQNPAVYLVAGDERRTLAMLSKVGQAVKGAEVATSCDTWHFFTTSGTLPALQRTEYIGRWENDLRLVDYRLGGEWSPGGTIELTMLWDVGRDEYREQYHFFNHLMSAEGTLVSQYDGVGMSSLDWIPGDRLVTWFRIPIPPDLPPGSYDVYSGLYAWPYLKRVPLVSGRGVDDRLWLTSVIVKD